MNEVRRRGATDAAAALGRAALTPQAAAAHRDVASGTVSTLLLFAALTTVVACASLTILAPETTLLGLIPDDAFYYLQIARHLVDTGVSTADGVSRTNGYHPLWMTICAGLSLVSRGWLTVRLVVAVSFGCHIATAFGIRRVLRQADSDAIADFAAAAWLVNPLTFAIACQSVEVTLYTFVLTLALACHLEVSDAIRHRGAVPGARYGLALGLVCLSRTEGLIAAAAGLGWLAFGLRHRTDAYPVLRRALLVLAIVILPWGIFTLTQVGTLTPDSGAMKSLWTSDLFPTWRSRIQNVVDTVDFFGRLGPRLAFGWPVPVVALAAMYLAGGTLVARAAFARPTTSGAALARAVAVCGAAVVATYGWMLSDRQIWWMGLPTLSLWFLGSIAIDRVTRSRGGRSRLAPAGLFICSWFAALTWSWGTMPLYPWQVDVYRSQSSIASLVPRHQRIGYFNAGIPMYFGSGREVALEGIVSHAALDRWRDKRLDDYLADASVSYIADETRALDRGLRFSRTRPALVELARFPLTGWSTPYRFLWRLEPRPGHVRSETPSPENANTTAHDD